MHREFAGYMKEAYPAWLKDLEGNRPPLSIDIVAEFLLPILQRDGLWEHPSSPPEQTFGVPFAGVAPLTVD